ncbi:acyl-CoA dehydrogenase family protein [Skermania piniformis]|uniref:Acyl-CoA/acyl-ACP dehydrogenase n=1 Tax=Skermania pinensis TaxID=39122 RepID=A0ABX8SF04_9ACTN|nr:acyl-CoA dehydrogenase family protein [Skermania piniformis]QXQ16031.1 acyl-CoA/acyl-ACP dehydrogenase [Skermania piniformis]
MDFARDESQAAVAEVAVELVRRAPGAALWPALVESGLLSAPLPARLGGDDLGLLGVCTLLYELARGAAEVPAQATLGLGVLPVLATARPEVADELLAGVATGAVLTAGLRQPGAGAPIRVETDAARGRLFGRTVGVPYAAQAAAILLPTDLGLAVVGPTDQGVSCIPTRTSAGTPEATLVLDGARARHLIEADPAVLHRYRLATVGAVADGLLAGAIGLTAGHVRTRHQFGKPLATFQAVAQQIADVYVTGRTLHVGAQSAAWRLAEGLDPDDDLAVLGYWIAAEVPPALRICHHLHGGIGVDVDYPLHRYSSQVKDLVRGLGGPSARLAEVGRSVGAR